jgi:hypothetical protein
MGMPLVAIAHLALLLVGTSNRWLAAVGTADISFIMALDGRATLSLCTVWGSLRFFKELVFHLGILCFGSAALPAISPIAHEELKAVCVDLHTRLEADAKISEVHLVLLGVSQEEGKMTCDGEEEVVVERRQVGEFVNEELGNGFRIGAVTGDAVLGLFGEKFIRELA